MVQSPRMETPTYPQPLKAHLRASVAAATLLGMAVGSWIVSRSAVAGVVEVALVLVGWIALNAVVFSRIDAALLPKDLR